MLLEIFFKVIDYFHIVSTFSLFIGQKDFPLGLFVFTYLDLVSIVGDRFIL